MKAILTIMMLMLGSSNVWADKGECTTEERREALRALQEKVLRVAPLQLDSLRDAIQPGGPLAGFGMSHGHVVMAHTGAVPIGNRRAKDPVPQLLQYAPSPSSSPADWLDYDRPSSPYRLIGWAYLAAPYEPGSHPPSLPCVAESEWFIHDAGWHLRDGGMFVTPGALVEPPRPNLEVGIVSWHPPMWDIHFWIEEDGVPTISFGNPRASGVGRRLPDDASYYLVNGRKEFPRVGK